MQDSLDWGSAHRWAQAFTQDSINRINTHTVPYRMHTSSSSQELKRLGREASHSLQNSDDVKKTCIYTSTAP
jgi:hypothetical protein